MQVPLLRASHAAIPLATALTAADPRMIASVAPPSCDSGFVLRLVTETERSISLRAGLSEAASLLASASETAGKLMTAVKSTVTNLYMICM
jgi:hypothetical protein